MISSFLSNLRDFLPNEFIAYLKSNAEFLKLLTFQLFISFNKI